ncbi:hypothetical protein E3N88_05259 [Mikania micrantha]|uniref:Retrovirus-related Pol polyprotein from transposon TNT 1-94-like beta-barrel domain-containing protein n=1 Tax=Mikania micrantha TaxID=192012 RepID=A0A5N6PYV6_9ASTR|nr:hypothetical protein E3N88_05259 [Mikania micrantha]
MGLVEHPLPISIPTYWAPTSQQPTSHCPLRRLLCPSTSQPITKPQVTNFDALSPSNLSQAFSTMQLNYTDPNLMMDTGAERHVTNNKGMLHQLDSFPVNTKLIVGNGYCLPLEGSGTGHLPILNCNYILPNILYKLNFRSSTSKLDASFLATIAREISTQSLRLLCHLKPASSQLQVSHGTTNLDIPANKF